MEFYKNLEPAMQHLTSKGAFLTVNDGKITNTMTISWGFAGVMWGIPCFMVMVRPQRYTREIIENADSFTVSIPFGTLSEALNICGTKSGRDINKHNVVRFVPSKTVSSPIVSGCDAYYECKIIYRDKFEGALIPDHFKKQIYTDDFHLFYFGEIVDCYGMQG